LLEDDGTKESGEIASVYAGMARLYWRTGENLGEAERLCEKALRMAEKFSLREVEAEVHQTLGFLLPITKKEEIMEHFQKSLRISIENGYFETTCRAYNNLGHLYVVLGGDMKRSIQFYLEGLRFERRIRNSMYYAYTKLALSLYAYMPMGEWTKAKESVNEFMPELSAQHPHRFASAFQILGDVALCRGEYGSAEEYFNLYLPLALKAKEVQAFVHIYISLGNLYFEKLDYTRAEEFLRRALETCRLIGLKLDNCMRYAKCLSLLSRVCGKQGKIQEATSFVSELSSITKSIDEDWAHGYYLRALGALLAIEGKYDEAIESFAKSAERWRRVGWPFELALDIYELGQAYLMIGEEKEALAQISSSLEIFTRLGAKAYVERASARKEILISVSSVDSLGSPMVSAHHNDVARELKAEHIENTTA
jgi:tetratricopeptide (TPR) repeat protein